MYGEIMNTIFKDEFFYDLRTSGIPLDFPRTDTENIKTFIKKVCYDYEPKIDKALENYRKEVKGEMFKDANRPLFSEETTRKILAHIAEENMQGEKLKNENQ